MNNKILIAGTIFLIIGMTGAAQQTEQSQFQPGEIFENEDTRLNAVYAVDQQNDFYGLLFSEDQANFFGTVDSFQALEGDNIRVCQHYLVRSGGFLGDVFGDERTASEVTCVPLRGEIGPEQGQLPVQPQQEQNQTQQQNQTNQVEPTQAQQQEQMQNQTPSSQMGFPDLFYAYDADGGYVTYVINNQGEVSNVVGTVQDINQLNQDSLVGCEYFFQAEDIAEAQNPSQVNCYGYEELQNMSEQGQIPYLDLGEQENQTQQNQTNQTEEDEGLFS